MSASIHLERRLVESVESSSTSRCHAITVATDTGAFHGYGDISLSSLPDDDVALRSSKETPASYHISPAKNGTGAKLRVHRSGSVSIDMLSDDARNPYSSFRSDALRGDSGLNFADGKVASSSMASRDSTSELEELRSTLKSFEAPARPPPFEDGVTPAVGSLASEPTTEYSCLIEQLRKDTAGLATSSSWPRAARPNPLPAFEIPASPARPDAYDDTPLNSSLAGLEGGHTSVAVLHALRALQDKIKRLETEKAQLQSQCSQLSQQLQAVRHQYERTSDDSTDRLNKLEADNRKVYASLHAQKNELHLKLIKREEEAKSVAREVDMMRGQLASAETEKQLATQRETHLRSRLESLEGELEKSQMRERDLQRNVSSVDAASRALKEAADSAKGELHAQLKHEKSSRHQAELKRIKTEEFLRSVIDINESLVKKVSTGDGESAGLAGRGRSRVGKKKAVKKIVSAASARPSQPFGLRSKLQTRPEERGTASSRARQAGRLESGDRKPRRGTRRMKDVHSQLKEANGGSIPFLLGSNTGPSFSIIGNVQSSIAPSEAYGVSGADLAVDDRRHEREAEAPEDDYDEARTDEDDARVGYSSRGRSEERGLSREEGLRPMVLMGHSEMAGVIESMEQEHEELGIRYRTLMAEAARGVSGHHMDETKLNNALQHLIEQMERKADQLNSLKRYHAAVLSLKERVPVRSPEAAGRKAKALRVLKGYRAITPPPHAKR